MKLYLPSDRLRKSGTMKNQLTRIVLLLPKLRERHFTTRTKHFRIERLSLSEALQANLKIIVFSISKSPFDESGCYTMKYSRVLYASARPIRRHA